MRSFNGIAGIIGAMKMSADETEDDDFFDSRHEAAALKESCHTPDFKTKASATNLGDRASICEFSLKQIHPDYIADDWNSARSNRDSCSSNASTVQGTHIPGFI